ncbi:DUF397 domain-containing protein [Streptomyces sp. NPDC001046]
MEVAVSPGATVALRDSKDPHGPVLTLHPVPFSTFVDWASTAAE